jgi:hypothetical protein
MKKTSKTINCCIRKTGHDKARIAFEIQTPLRHDSTRTEILREFQENNELSYCPEGLLLAPGTTRTLIAITPMPGSPLGLNRDVFQQAARGIAARFSGFWTKVALSDVNFSGGMSARTAPRHRARFFAPLGFRCKLQSSRQRVADLRKWFCFPPTNDLGRFGPAGQVLASLPQD